MGQNPSLVNQTTRQRYLYGNFRKLSLRLVILIIGIACFIGPAAFFRYQSQKGRKEDSNLTYSSALRKPSGIAEPGAGPVPPGNSIASLSCRFA